MERITEAFVWPFRDPEWPAKIAIIGLLLLIPILGSVNGLGWMLASLDRLRAGEERLAPANLSYLGRGVRVYVVVLIYLLVLLAVGFAIYLPGLALAVQQGHGQGNAALIAVAIVLNLISFGV